MPNTATSLHELLNIMQQLREQCPWDKAQTPSSLTRYAIEEAYEVEAAVRDGDTEQIKDELADLLLQVVFQAQMFSEQQQFNFDDIVQHLSKKLIRRHPHVFAKRSVSSMQALDEQWAQIKQAERGGQRRRLDEIKAGPALMQAQALQKQAAKVGFDWPDVHGAVEKLDEEIAELKVAIQQHNQQHMSDELGDCFFSLVNVARKLGIQSEVAMLGTIHKFKHRFAYIEDQLTQQGKTPEDSSLAEMDRLWCEAKKR